MELFRQALLHPGHPQEFALQTVQQVIKPQKQVKLVQDENQLLENILRTLLQELVAASVQSSEEIMQYGQSIADGDTTRGQIPRLLDIVVYLCEKEHIEGGMIFQLLEDLTEMSTMRNCKDIFGYIESKQEILGKPELFARGKLVMLRTCNQLLRRLSKANDVVFCGRIIMFLAHFFPLSERSAVNIKGVFNTSNETKYEKEAPESSSIDFNFYNTFWSLQEYFSNPTPLTTNTTKWQKFTSSLTVVLSTFEAQPLSDEEGNAINLEDEASNFSIKYLTSSNLMGLELKDPSFRRHVLVQCLILFDYLKAPGKTDKDSPSDAMKEEIKSCEERVKKLLEVTPPLGKEFLQGIEHILEREQNWVWWKRDGCPPFEKPPIEKKLAQDVGKKRRPRWRLGNKELSQLWRWAEQNPNALTDPQRVSSPSIMDYWKPLADDMDESAGIEEEYHHKNNRVYCWKGLRFSARQDLEGFSKFSEHGIEGVVPLELLPPEVRSKYQAKPGDKNKRLRKEETNKGSLPPIDHQSQETETTTPANENDIDGISRNEREASVASMETDAAVIVTPTAADNLSQEGTPNQEENSDQKNDNNSDNDDDDDEALEAGQIEADEPGMIDGDGDGDVEA